MERKKSAEEWRRVFEEWRASGMSRSAFCREKDIAFSTFDYWKKKVSGRQRLVRLSGVMLPKSTASTIRVVVDERVTVELSRGFDEEELSVVLRTLGALSCS